MLARFATVTVALMLLPALVAGQEDEMPVETVDLDTVYLWDDAPGARGDAEEDRPRLHPLLADAARANGTAVIVCPGGGYWVRAMDYEGLQVAQWLNSVGVHAFLLSYRIRTQGYESGDAFVDGTRAVRWLRHHATDYGVDPHRIGMVGFSAGGHLISRIALQHDPGDPDAQDAIERESSRPDFLMFAYTPPAGSWRAGNEDEEIPPVTAKTPPTFIYHTSEDGIAATGVVGYYEALRQAGVEAEMHVFGGYGPHGAGLATGVPGASMWPELAYQWMRKNAFLTGKQRASLEGTLTIDGRLADTAWITFVPVESPDDPVAAVRTKPYKDDDGTQVKGRFELPARHGPVPGSHRVEVRHISKKFMTVPSMEREMLYTAAHPDSQEPLTVQIEPGHNVLDIRIETGTAGRTDQARP